MATNRLATMSCVRMPRDEWMDEWISSTDAAAWTDDSLGSVKSKLFFTVYNKQTKERKGKERNE